MFLHQMFLLQMFLLQMFLLQMFLHQLFLLQMFLCSALLTLIFSSQYMVFSEFNDRMEAVMKKAYIYR